MSKDETKQMAQHGITTTTVSVFHYKDYRYSKLSDAVNFAKIDQLQARGKQEPSMTDS